MGRRNRPGQIALDDIKLEGGIVVHVRLNKESGIFYADYMETYEGENQTHHDTKSWEGKDLEKIRAEVREWAANEKALKWEPVIAVGPKDSFGLSQGTTVLGQTFQRLLRGKKHKGGGYEWRYWAFSKPAKNGETHTGFVYDKDLEVYPPAGKTHEPSAFRDGDVNPVILEYTPERWLALLQLVEMEKALKEKLNDLVVAGEGKLAGFLANVPKIGLLGLAPKEAKPK